MRVLIGCERSGALRRAFRALGHNAWSCDLEPAQDDSRDHFRGDVMDVLVNHPWDLVVVHPPCTYLSVSGLHWNKRRPERAQKTEEAMALVQALFAYAQARRTTLRFALENPISCISTRVRRPDQIIQPHQFGDNASKATCLWLMNLPTLRHTNPVAPRMVNGRPRWANQTDSGQNRLGPSPGRAAARAETYPGIAAAMAQQWSTT